LEDIKMLSRSPLRLPLLLLAILSVTIVAGAAAIFGFADREPVAMPDWVWCSPRAAAGSSCSVGVRFSLREPVSSAVLRLTATGPARAQIDGRTLGATGASGEPVEIKLGDLAAGSHDLRIDATHGSGLPGVSAFIDLPTGASDRSRIASDASWENRSAGDGSMVSVTGPYAAGPRPDPFGGISSSVLVAKGARFWVMLLMLVLAMAVACLAGPILRPPGQSSRDTWLLDGAIIVPSIAYGAVAVLICSLAATAISTGLLVALHLVSTTVLVLLLVAWKTGARHIEQDQVTHRAELQTYDSLCESMELLQLDLSQAAPELRSVVQGPMHELAEAVRYASTGTAVPDLDRSIVASIESLRESVRDGGGDGGAAGITNTVRKVMARVREREIRLQSARRA
jgi:hypothetical protein